MITMKTFIQPEPSNWDKILRRPLIDVSELHATVGQLLKGIRENGEKALREYTLKFDGVETENWEVTAAEFEAAGKAIPGDLKSAIQTASANISRFHSAQTQEARKIETQPGVFCWQKTVAIERVGLYIPGGTAPLFSTVLMLAIPARLAGCKEIILCTPPARDGSVHPAILYAAKLAGVTRIFKLGGVQAIGAMAYGVVTPKVDKIFGPGNQYVMAAKQLVSFNDVAIDMPAGPSEVAVIADESANPAFIAADLLSQAEHGADSQVILVLKGDKLLQAIKEEVALQLEQLPRKEMAAKALGNSSIIILENEDEMVDLINFYAPEHLIISMRNYVGIAAGIINAGSVFLGNYTPESAGDYASGTNHTLPTNGWARSYSGVNMDSFVKKITFQEITPDGLKNLGPIVEIMAEAEQLQAHKNAVSVRINALNKR
jgi:histidinol dehydrogenase